MNHSGLDCIVVGSGPSGVACAAALLEQGRSVTMVDPGLDLEPDRAAVVRAAASATDELRPVDAPWTRVSSASDEAIPRKLAFGSTFPFDVACEWLGLSASGGSVEPSFARGGLSNIWGAAVLPYVDRDIADWPITSRELAPHFKACAAMLPIAGVADDLQAEFPLYCGSPGSASPSAQADAMMRSLERNRAQLVASGISFGRARIAIRTGPDGCRYCGLCLHGCPYNHIFNSNWISDNLAQNPRFTYQAGIVVDTVGDDNNNAWVAGRALRTNIPVALSAKRVFLAAGVIPSSAIILRTFGLYERPVAIKDSQYFLLPLVTLKPARGVDEERLHTLSQIFVEILDKNISPYTVHLQVYGYNSLMAQAVRQRLGRFASALAARAADERLMLIQGYLHSSHSGEIDLKLSGTPHQDRVELAPRINPQTKPTIGKIVRKLIANAPRLGAIAIPPLMTLGEPGRGFHCGATLPMRASPAKLETDVLGRVPSLVRVHIVDASVLPSIPATTITFATMANAHRIATHAAALD